jgi:hypothetical protein
VPTSSNCGGQSPPSRISAAAASFRFRPAASMVRRSLAACNAAGDSPAVSLPLSLMAARPLPG